MKGEARLLVETADRARIEGERGACGSSLRELPQKASTQKRVGETGAKEAGRRDLLMAGGRGRCCFARDLRIVALANLTRSGAPDSLADACERRRGNF